MKIYPKRAICTHDRPVSKNRSKVVPVVPMMYAIISNLALPSAFASKSA